MSTRALRFDPGWLVETALHLTLRVIGKQLLERALAKVREMRQPPVQDYAVTVTATACVEASRTVLLEKKEPA